MYKRVFPLLFLSSPVVAGCFDPTTSELVFHLLSIDVTACAVTFCLGLVVLYAWELVIKARNTYRAKTVSK